MAYFPVLLLGCSKILDFGVALCFFCCFFGSLSLFSGKGFPYLSRIWFFVSAFFVGFGALFF